jgi:hypothetical protein
MKAAKLSSFHCFELTTEEEIQAYTYNDCQVAGIQNLIAAAAEEIVSVALEADQLSLEAQKKLAYTKGQIDILKTLLARADVIAETLAAAQDQ